MFVEPVDQWTNRLTKSSPFLGLLFPIGVMMIAYIPILVSMHPFKLRFNGPYSAVVAWLMYVLWLTSFTPILACGIYLGAQVRQSAAYPTSQYPMYPPSSDVFIGGIAFAFYLFLSFKLCGEALARQIRPAQERGSSNAY
jgi:hypothetical protein